MKVFFSNYMTQFSFFQTICEKYTITYLILDNSDIIDLGKKNTFKQII